MSGGSTVSFKLSATDSDAVRAWDHLRREGPQTFDQEVKKLARSMKKTANDGQQDFKRLGGQMSASFKEAAASAVSFNAVIGMSRQIAGQLLNTLKEIELQKQKTTLSFDEAGRQLQVQAGLTDAQRQQEVKDAFGAGNRLALDPGTVLAIQKQLASSGFTQEAVLGQGAEIVGEAGLASNFSRGDQGQFVDAAKAAGLFLSSTGGDKALTSGNLRNVLQGSQRLFKGTNFQLSELANLAEEGGVLAQTTGASNEEILATFALLRQKGGAARGATGFRTFASRLTGLSEDSAQGKALAEIGLGVGDVDFVGESYQDVLGRLNKAFKSTDGATAARVRKQLFGEEGGAAAAAIINDESLATIKRNIALQRDQGGFQSDLAIRTTGASADVARAQIAEQEAQLSEQSAQNAVNNARYAAERARMQQEGGLLNTVAATRGMIAESVGITPEAANAVGISTDAYRDAVGTNASVSNLTAFANPVGMPAMNILIGYMRRSAEASEKTASAVEGNAPQANANAFEDR